jgi:hypothetical protein
MLSKGATGASSRSREATMSTTEYVVLLHGDARAWRDQTADEAERNDARHAAFGAACAERGHVITGGSELVDYASATVVRRPAGEPPVVSEGPFTELVEQLGGFYVVETADLDGLVRLVAHHLIELAEIRATVPQSAASDAAPADVAAEVAS